MKKLAILFALSLCVALAGCNQPAPPQGGEPSEPQETPEVEVIITEPEEPTPPTGEQTATLYIGTKAEGFNEYPMTYEGDLTAEKLIQSIADLTGWDLTLAEDVISGKGGMSVCLSSASARPTRRERNSICTTRSSLRRRSWTASRKPCRRASPARAATRTRWIFGTTWRGISR